MKMLELYSGIYAKLSYLSAIDIQHSLIIMKSILMIDLLLSPNPKFYSIELRIQPYHLLHQTRINCEI